MEKENFAPPDCNQLSTKLTHIQRPEFKCKRKLSFLSHKNRKTIMPPTTSNRLSLSFGDLLDKTDPEKLVQIIREKRGLRNVQRIFVDSDRSLQNRGSFPIEIQQKEKPREVSVQPESEVVVAESQVNIDEPIVVSDENSPNVNTPMVVVHSNVHQHDQGQSQKSTKSTRIPQPRVFIRLPQTNLARRALHNAFDRVQGENNDHRDFVASTPLQARFSTGNPFGSDISNIETSPSCEFLQNNLQPKDGTPVVVHSTKATAEHHSAISHRQQEHSNCLQGTLIHQESMEIEETQAGRKSIAATTTARNKSRAATKIGDYCIDETNMNTAKSVWDANHGLPAGTSHQFVNIQSHQSEANASRNPNVVCTAQHHQSFAVDNRQVNHEPLHNCTNSHINLTGNNTQQNTLQHTPHKTNTTHNISVKNASNIVSTLVNAIRRSRTNSFLAPGTPPRSQPTPQKMNDASYTIPPTQSPQVHHACQAATPSIAVIPVYPPQMCNQNHSQLAAPAAFTPVKSTQQQTHDYSQLCLSPLPNDIASARQSVEIQSPARRSKRQSLQRSSQPLAESSRRDIRVTSDEDGSPRKRPKPRSRSTRDIPPNGNDDIPRKRRSNRAQSTDLTQFEMTSDEEHSEDRIHRTQDYTQNNNGEARSVVSSSQSNAVDLRVTARRSTVHQIETTQSELSATSKGAMEGAESRVSRRLSRRSASHDMSFNEIQTIDRLLKQLENQRRDLVGEQQSIQDDDDADAAAAAATEPTQTDVGADMEIVQTFDEDIFEVDDSLPVGNDGQVYDFSPRMGKLWMDSMMKQANARKTIKAKTKKGPNAVSQNALRLSQGVTYNEVESCLRQKMRSTRSHRATSNNQSRRKLYSKGFSENEASFSDHEKSLTFLPGSGHANDGSNGSMQSVLDRKTECMKFQSTPKYAKIQTIQHTIDDWFGAATERDTPPKKKPETAAKPPDDDEMIFKMPHVPLDRKLGQRKRIHLNGRSHLAFRDKTNIQDPIRQNDNSSNDESAYHSQSSCPTSASSNRSANGKNPARMSSQIIRITRSRIANCSKLAEEVDDEGRTSESETEMIQSRVSTTAEQQQQLNRLQSHREDPTDMEHREQPVDPDQNITKTQLNSSKAMERSRKSSSFARHSRNVARLEDDEPDEPIENEDPGRIQSKSQVNDKTRDPDGSSTSSKLATPSRVAEKASNHRGHSTKKSQVNEKTADRLSNARDPDESSTSAKLTTPSSRDTEQAAKNSGHSTKKSQANNKTADRLSNARDSDGSSTSSKLATPSRVTEKTSKNRGHSTKSQVNDKTADRLSNARDPDGSSTSSKLATPSRVAEKLPKSKSRPKKMDIASESTDSDATSLRRSARKHRLPRPYWTSRVQPDYDFETISYKEKIPRLDRRKTARKSKQDSSLKAIQEVPEEKKSRKNVKKTKQPASALKAVQEDPEDEMSATSILSPVEDDKEPKQRADDLFEALKEMSMNKGSEATNSKKAITNSTSNVAPRPTSPTPSTSTSSTKRKRKKQNPPAPKAAAATAAASSNVPNESTSPATNYMSTDSGHATDANHDPNPINGQNFLLTWLKQLVEPRTISSNPDLHKILRLSEVEIAPVSNLIFQTVNGVDYAYYDTSQGSSERYGYMRFHPNAVKRKAKAKLCGLRLLSLLGELELCIDEKKIILKNGDFISVPKGVRYKLLNKSSEMAVIFFMQQMS